MFKSDESDKRNEKVHDLKQTSLDEKLRNIRKKEIANVYDDINIDNPETNNNQLNNPEEITYNDTNHQIVDEEITISNDAIEDVIDKETQVEEYQLQNKSHLYRFLDLSKC